MEVPQDEYVPRLQAEQYTVFVFTAYDPPEHLVQTKVGVDPAREYDPAGQSKQSDCSSELAGELCPFWHETHDDSEVAPTVAEYLPCSHEVHAVASVAAVDVENLPATQL